MQNTTAPQSVLILMDETPFEGSSFVGAFTSVESADNYFQNVYKKERNVYPDDTYTLYETEIDPQGRSTYKKVTTLY